MEHKFQNCEAYGVKEVHETPMTFNLKDVLTFAYFAFMFGFIVASVIDLCQRN